MKLSFLLFCEQRKMNVNQTLVRTEVVVWLITLVEDLIVNVHWDSEEPPVWVGVLKN